MFYLFLSILPSSSLHNDDIAISFIFLEQPEVILWRSSLRSSGGVEAELNSYVEGGDAEATNDDGEKSKEEEDEEDSDGDEDPMVLLISLHLLRLM